MGAADTACPDSASAARATPLVSRTRTLASLCFSLVMRSCTARPPFKRPLTDPSVSDQRGKLVSPLAGRCLLHLAMRLLRDDNVRPG